MARQGKPRTAWHPLFAALIEERKPSGFEVRTEVTLSTEPQRADLLLLRRSGGSDEGQVLRGLWPRLAAQTLAEFKSSTRPARVGDLLRLVGYGLQYHVRQRRSLVAREDLNLALLMPTLNRGIRADLEMMGWRAEPLGDGYHRVIGAPYETYLAGLRDIAGAEHDPLLNLFADRTLKGLDDEGVGWLADHLATSAEGIMANEHVSAEVRDKLKRYMKACLPPKERLDGLTGKERLEGLTPEQRVEAIDLDDAVLKLPDDVLRALPPAFVEGLPEEIQAKIRTRLGE